MAKQDSKNALDENPFSFRQFKNGKISISWNDKEVLLLKGKKSR